MDFTLTANTAKSEELRNFLVAYTI